MNKIIILFYILIVLSSCSKEFINPYDPATPADVWMPSGLRLDTLGANKVRLFWEQDNRHIDGYAVQKFTNGQSKEYLVFRDTIDFIDSNVVETNVEATCPEIRYEVLARAGSNRSLAAGMQTPIYMPLSTPAYAGEDIMVIDTATSVQLNAQPTLPGESGRWTIISGTGGAFENDRQHNSRFIGTPCNAYILRWTKQGCTESYDELNVAFYPATTTSNAGSDQSFNDATTQTTLNANQPATGQTGIWTVVSGEGGVFADASSPTTQFTGQSCTAYVLKWSLSGNCFSSDDNVNISFFKAPTAANAGSNQTITTDVTTVTLTANTPASGETGIWSIISGAGGSFTNSNAPNTTFTGNACTAYTLRWTIQGQCSNSSDDLTIGFAQSNTTANAGIDQTITTSATSVTLAANTPASGETGTWSIISGAGGSFSNINAANATFTGSACTSYTLRWTLQSPCSNNYNDVNITFQQSVTQSNAGPDQTNTTSYTSVSLAANNPAIAETGTWSVLNGTGGSFSNINAPNAIFTGSACTSYTLRWTIQGECLNNFNDVIISFQQSVSQANAGTDQSFVNSNIQTTLYGNSLLAGETGLWSIISGVGGVIQNPTSPTTSFTGASCQTYTLQWTKTACLSTSTDNLIVSFDEAVTNADAGQDQMLTSLTTSLAANTPAVNETGQWSIISGNGGSFSNTSVSNPIFTGVAGVVYTLKWKIIGPCNQSEDNVFITMPGLPSISTNSASSITAISALSGGFISSDGGSEIIQRGVCWSTSPLPTIALSTKTTDGSGLGSFTSQVITLSPNTAYYLRSYATSQVGTAYGNQVTFNTTALSVGVAYQGGIVAYIYQSGDPGYSSTTQHGIIAAASDLSDNITWSNGSNILTYSEAIGIGAGLANTNTIIAAQGIGYYAASICANAVINGYSDWYLPSLDELNKLYISRNQIGGFVNDIYWSSSEISFFTVYVQWFGNTLDQSIDDKDVPYRVRPIRYF